MSDNTDHDEIDGGDPGTCAEETRLTRADNSKNCLTYTDRKLTHKGLKDVSPRYCKII